MWRFGCNNTHSNSRSVKFKLGVNDETLERSRYCILSNDANEFVSIIRTLVESRENNKVGFVLTKCTSLLAVEVLVTTILENVEV